MNGCDLVENNITLLWLISIFPMSALGRPIARCIQRRDTCFASEFGSILYFSRSGGNALDLGDLWSFISRVFSWFLCFMLLVATLKLKYFTWLAMATDCSLPLPITSTASLFSSFHILHFRILYGMVSRKNAQQRWFNGLCFLALILVRRDSNHYNSLTKDNCPLSFVRFWKILVIMLWLLLEHMKIFSWQFLSQQKCCCLLPCFPKYDFLSILL